MFLFIFIHSYNNHHDFSNVPIGMFNIQSYTVSTMSRCRIDTYYLRVSRDVRHKVAACSPPLPAVVDRGITHIINLTQQHLGTSIPGVVSRSGNLNLADMPDNDVRLPMTAAPTVAPIVYCHARSIIDQGTS